jgi:hypothetical protein
MVRFHICHLQNGFEQANAPRVNSCNGRPEIPEVDTTLTVYLIPTFLYLSTFIYVGLLIVLEWSQSGYQLCLSGL